MEKLAGKPLNDVMTERVFIPLKMSRSGYVWNSTFDSDFALPHTKTGGPRPKNKSNQANAAYSLQTTADDYARFLLAILTPTGLKKGTVNQMLSSQGQLPKSFSGGDSLSATLQWGLGFGLEKTPVSTYFWHWGDNGTYKYYVVSNRDSRDAVVYFTNSENGLSLIDEISRQYMGISTSTVDFLGYKSYKRERKDRKP